MATPALSYIACDVPDGMRLAAWRRAAEQQRPKHRKIRHRLRRHH